MAESPGVTGRQAVLNVGHFGTAQITVRPDGTGTVYSCCYSEPLTRAELAALRDLLTWALEPGPRT